ncbi:hypothetical protein [Chryseobacterium sp. R2A-55]|uniref:hypothetical protein n=1 Tax=Chryseobacterium sp. R2A-55 TaxID=2744445 RepID=UPI001F3160AB|nr:hypothetical protein [Chryseobacterium sp. R2A-55]
MAQVVESDKVFKVIKMTRSELVESLGGYGICDHCNDSLLEGYYVAVLNHWICEADYFKWHESAVNHPEDKELEEWNFNNTKQTLNL